MINSYMDQLRVLLFEDTGHAWIFVSLIYWLAALFIQSLLSAPINRAAKRISSKNLKSVHSFYLLRSVSGWISFIFAWGFFVLYWYAQHFNVDQIPRIPEVYLAACVIFFLLSVIFHLGAYATACLDQIKLLEDKQLTP